MNAFGKRTLQTIETPDEIQFILVRQGGWATQLLSVTVILGFFWEALRSSNLMWCIFCLVGVFVLIADRLHGNTTQLQVTRTELTARGNLSRAFQDRFAIDVAAVKSIGYQSGGENDSSGLYVTGYLQNFCVLPGINREESRHVVEAIYRKFPDMKIGDYDARSLFFGPNGGLITLGISNRQ